MTKLFLLRTSFLLSKTLLFSVNSAGQSLHSLLWSTPNSFIFRTIVYDIISHTSYFLFPLLWLCLLVYTFNSNRLSSSNVFCGIIATFKIIKGKFLLHESPHQHNGNMPKFLYPSESKHNASILFFSRHKM